MRFRHWREGRAISGPRPNLAHGDLCAIGMNTVPSLPPVAAVPAATNSHQQVSAMTTATAKHPVASMLSVYDGRLAIGFILRRGPIGVEGFTAENESLGCFRTEDEAATALWKYAHKQPLAGEHGDPP